MSRLSSSFSARWFAVSIVLLLGVLAPAAVAQAPGTAADAAPGYRIGAGDVLLVFVYEEDSRDRVIVRPDGMITLPMVGDVPAAGKAPHEVAAVVAQAFSRFYKKQPMVTVAVEEIHSYRIYLLGNLGAQQSLESGTPLRLLQAIATAGGLNEFASKKILVLRDEDGKQTVREVDYDKIIKGKAPDQNIWLRSGDVVIAR